MKNFLILIRGLPGSGKSTKANQLLDQKVVDAHFEADQYCMKDGVYKFDSSKVSDNHQSCQEDTFSALLCGDSVVVSNTFTKTWEMLPYIDFCWMNKIPWTIIECLDNYGSIHSVPINIIEKMKQRWESSDELKKMEGYFENNY